MRTEPASVVAARQLVADAESGAHPRRRRPTRRVLVRAGAAVLAVAAAWTAAVAVTSADRPAPQEPVATPSDPTTSPTRGTTDAIRLVTAETAAFPLSMDPPPAGLSPVFSWFGGVPYTGTGRRGTPPTTSRRTATGSSSSSSPATRMPCPT